MDDLRFTDALVNEFVEREVQEGFPGAVLIVTRYGQTVKQAVNGYQLKYDENATEIDRAELFTLDTMFDLATLTKMFATNDALMHLAKQERLNVNDPVVKYIPKYRGCCPTGECRLIRDLLTHTAGYAPNVQFYNPARVPADSVFAGRAAHRRNHRNQARISTIAWW